MSNVYKKFKAQLDDQTVTELEVSPGEFQALINDPLTKVGIPKPQPPIKNCRKEIRFDGKWWERKREVVTEFVEYDYHAKEYLEAMERWEAESRYIRNGIYFMGKRIILRDPQLEVTV